MSKAKETYEEPLVKAHDPLADITAQVGTAKGKDVKEKDKEKETKEYEKVEDKIIDKTAIEKLDREVPD